MLATYPQFGNGVEYLKGLSNAVPGPVPKINFVGATRVARHRVKPTVREPVPMLEGHQLRVVYKRRRPCEGE